MVDKQRQIDEQEMKTLETDKENFLLQAVGNYLKCLRVGDRHDLRVFRLTSLWFDNNTSQQINTHIRVSNYTRSSYDLFTLPDSDSDSYSKPNG